MNKRKKISILDKKILGAFLSFQAIVLGGYTFYMLKSSYDIKKRVNSDKHYIQEIEEINELINNLEKERGLNLQFLEVKKTNNILNKILKKQEQKVNDIINGILSIPNLETNLKNLIIGIKKQLKISRKNVLSKKWTVNKEFQTYFKISQQLFKVLLIRSNSIHYKKDLKAFALLSYASNNMSIIRDRLFYYLIEKKKIPLKYINYIMLHHYISIEELKNTTFLKIDPILKNSYNRYITMLIDNKKITADKNFFWINMTSLIHQIIHTEKFYLTNTKRNINIEYNKSEQFLLLALLMGFFTLLLILLTLKIVKTVNNYTSELERMFFNLQQTLGKRNIEEINLKTVDGVKAARKLIASTVTEMTEARKRAEEMVKVKSLFLANMSHEIRTPLNGILGFLELLKTTPLNELQEEYINTISQSAKNLLQIVNNILNVSKIESNKVDVEIIDTKFTDEIENTIEIFGAPTAQKKIKYISYLDPSIPEIIKTDPVKIKEIMTNLINNAIKFTHEGGQIYVEVSNKGIRTDEYGRELVKVYFEVKDTGIGMTSKQREKVFEAFTQADESITRKYGGTGLGLTLVKNYIEMMGGEIKVESQVNKGTKFFFELEFEITKKEPKISKDAFKGKTFAILVLDKKTAIMDIVNKYLKYLGINQVSVTSNGELESLKSKIKIDATLIFYEYSDISKIKDLLQNRVPVILLTSHFYKQEIEPFKTINIYDPIFVSKIKNAVLAVENKKISKIKNSEETKKHFYDLTALIAEDNPINMKLLKTMLEKMGIKVDTAVNGLEAFSKYSANPEKYDVIFMDMQMPVMNGVEATHEILNFEKEEDIPHIPIIAATANALENDRERFLGQGLDDYFSKPIKKEEIIKVLENVTNGVYKNAERAFKNIKKEENNLKQTEPNDQISKNIYVITDIDFFKELFETLKEIYPNIKIINSDTVKKTDNITKVIIAGKLNNNITDQIKNSKIYIIENNDYKGIPVNISELETEISKII